MEIKVADAGGPLHYADYGGHGPAMVLVHGLGGSHLNWQAVGPRLARRHRVLAPDLVGFGDTPLAGRSSTVHQNQIVLERFLLDVVREPAILVGNSMGGMLAAFAAARRPAYVSRLILVDPACPNPRYVALNAVTAAFAATLLMPGSTVKLLRRRAQRIGAEALVRQTLEVVCRDPGRVSKELVEAHIELTERRMATMPWSEEALLEAARSITRTMIRRGAYYRRIAAVQAPTLVIQGAEDRVIPLAAVEDLVRRRPDWALQVMAGVGHVPMMEVPEAFADRVETWLLTGSETAKAG